MQIRVPRMRNTKLMFIPVIFGNKVRYVPYIIYFIYDVNSKNPLSKNKITRAKNFLGPKKRGDMWIQKPIFNVVPV